MELDPEQVSVSWIASVVACVVLNNLYYDPVLTMESVVVGIRLIGDVHTNLIPLLEPPHYAPYR
ncbi:hypothetical protein ACFQS5_07895 [Salinirubellus sp. GCM10025899]|uniref:hypothetical protein n=1 Tax=Salinirubellus sp. GCM10025899 TaxID=3252689 RepID=UPI00362400CA